MKKIILIILFSFTIILNAQEYSFGVVSNLQFSESKKASVDSLVRKINSIDQLSFVLFTGSLTNKGNQNEFLSLKKSLDSLKSQYILLPYGNDTRDVQGWETFLEFSGDDKFIYNSNGYLFIGINPTLPYLNIDTYTEENIKWLEQIIDTVKLNREIYFVSPVPFESISGWESVFEILTKKNLKAIINCGSVQLSQKNIFGITTFELPPKNNFVITLSNDTAAINSFDDKQKTVINKSVALEVKLPNKINSVDNKINQFFNLSSNSLTYASPIYWNGKIYTSSTDGIVTCYDSTGQMLWDYNTFGNIIGTPVISDRMIAISTLQGDLITLSSITGEQIQTIGFEEIITTSLTVIDYQGSRILMIPKLTDSKSAILFGTASGRIYCYDLETLQEYWSNSNAKGIIRSKPISINNKIFFTADDGFLYCIDARNGLLIWRWKEKADTDFSNSSITTDGKKVFVVSAEGTLYAIDNLLGKLVWKNEKVNLYEKLTLSKDNKTLICKGKDSKIYFLDTETGKLLKELKFDGKLYFSQTELIQLNGNLIFANNNSIYKSVNNKIEQIYSNGYSPFNSLVRIDNERFMGAQFNGSVIIFSLR